MTIAGTGNFPAYRRPADRDDNALISSAIREALSYLDELAPERVKATEMYHGLPLGNEVAGRSQARMTEVRDAIQGAIPGLLRILHGPEHTVEYVPKRGDAVAAAEQATDYARYIFEEDNRGLIVTHNVLKDGLLKKIGIVAWGMDAAEEVETRRYANLSLEDLQLLAAEEGAEIRVVAEEAGLYVADRIRRIPSGRIWVREVPPDDFFWNREARSLDDARLIGFRNRLTKKELNDLGVSDSDIEEYGGSTPEVTQEEQARRTAIGTVWGEDPNMGDANRRYTYCRVYFKGADGLRLYCTLGDSHAVIKEEPVSRVNVAVFSPDPEPHSMLGGSFYDRLKDMEVINSALVRGFFDSLSVSLFPRPVYVDGQVSVADILNTGINTPIRARAPGMVSFDVIPFTGDKVLPALQMTREMVERRTGNKDGAMSMDMDALQSTDKGAVDAALLAAQGPTELIARLYAEQVMKPLFRGLLELMTEPQSRKRIVRLRGQYTEVNPVTWDRDMDVTVNVAIGSTNTDRKLALLEKVATDQSAVLQMLGPANPVVTLPMWFNTKRKALSLAGLKDAENYYIPLPPDWQPPPPPPPEPTPDQLWIQHEKEMQFQKDMKELAIKQDELALKKMQAEQEAELRAIEIEVKRRAAETGPHNEDIEKYKVDVETASRERIEAARLELEREKMLLDAQTKLQVAEKQAESAREQAKMQAESAKETAQLSAASKERADKEKGKAASKPVQVVVEQPELGKLAKAITDLKNTPPTIHVPAPVVNVPTPVVHMPAQKRRGRKAKITGPDGSIFTLESDGDE